MLRDLDGDQVDDFPTLNAALAGAIRADRVVVDAHVTHQPIQAIAEVAARAKAVAPKATAAMIGARSSPRKRRPPSARCGSAG